MVYWPQLGYLITVPLRGDMKAKEDFEVDGLSFQFCTDSMIYYRNTKTQGLSPDILTSSFLFFFLSFL